MQVPNPMASNSGYAPEKQTKKKGGRDIWPCIYLDFGPGPMDRLEPGAVCAESTSCQAGTGHAFDGHRWLAANDIGCAGSGGTGV